MALMSGAFMGILRPGMGLPACPRGLWLVFLYVCKIYISDVFFPAWLTLFSYVHLSMATWSAGLSLVSVPLSAPLQNGFAIIRPPGHHAEESTAM